MTSQTDLPDQPVAEYSDDRLTAALQVATDALRAERTEYGNWTGELSSSALSTATAITALNAVDPAQHAELIRAGLHWLERTQNPDGGWGDTTLSKSNISTTALVWAAFGATKSDSKFSRTIAGAERWLAAATGREVLDEDRLIEAIERRYGKDRTFSVPILMMCALAGRLRKEAWRRIFALPFELAALPHQLFGALQLPVVSYALPALIAIGQVIHAHAPSRFLPLRWLRSMLRGRTLKVLSGLQPTNGGFLEATPLTSFVTMALAGANQATHEVARKGVQFLVQSARPDGSWAIDTNLATWTTTMAIKALSYQPGSLPPEDKQSVREWLLDQQYRKEHPYTHAAPGGWAWTNLPGGVPDADDTPGALIALLQLGLLDTPARIAGEAGVKWLLDLQNRDGGIPTFCRGWGALPFDRSSPDLTAHTLRAWAAWLPHLSASLQTRVHQAIPRALDFLEGAQREDGNWLPLWFGNEHAPDDENPIYGTTHVLLALRALDEASLPCLPNARTRGEEWLAGRQSPDGSWSSANGAPASVEETALAVECLAGSRFVSAVQRGTQWLIESVESGNWRQPAPIGFYFAKLWYYEKLYPMIWTVAALGRVAQLRALQQP